MLLECNPLFSISSRSADIVAGYNREEQEVKKGSERKGDEDREEKSGSLESRKVQNVERLVQLQVASRLPSRGSRF